MKKLFMLIAFLSIFITQAQDEIFYGGLETSTIWFQSLTTAERNNLSPSPTFGTIIRHENGGSEQLEMWNGTTWTALGGFTTPSLQQVTDVSGETDNSITVTGDDDSFLGVQDLVNANWSILEPTRHWYFKDNFTLEIVAPTLTGNRSITYQNGDGTLAFLSDIPISSSLPSQQIGYGDGSSIVGNDDFVYNSGLNNLTLKNGFFGSSISGTAFRMTESSGNFVEMAYLNTNPTIKLYKGGFGSLIYTPTITADRDFILPDADVDFTGGSDGDVLTVQSDGSIEFETPSSGGTDDQTASEVSATPYLTLTSDNVEGQIQQLKDELDLIDTGGATGITSVVDVTALRGFTTAPLNGSVFFLVEHTKDKKGGGFLYWDDTSTDTDDNFETFKATTITTGRFKRIIKDNTASIEEAGALSDDILNDTQAFLDVRDYFVSVGGGKIIIPNRGNERFYITTGTTNSLADYSNITINGGGKIYIDELADASNSRGVFVKLADGTDNFTIENIDILVDEDAVSEVNYNNGVICSEQVDDCQVSNVTIQKVKIHSEVRPDSAIGNHGITFVRNGTSHGDFTNFKIEDCDIKLYGHSIYGIHLQQNFKDVDIVNNRVELTAGTSAPNEAYNAIAVYGSSEFVNVTRNHAWGGHSPYAVSTAGETNITYNWAYNCTVTGEAGFEFEYKGGHGEVGYQPQNVNIIGNHSIGNYIGYLITDRLNDATSKSPRNVYLSANHASGSVLSDLEITSAFGAGGNNTTRISNVIVDGNFFLSDCSYANIASRDGSNLKIINNELDGGNDAIHLGRNSTIKVRGTIDIDNNIMRNYTESGIRVESADNVHLSIDDNEMYGGERGLFINGNLNTGGESYLSATNNLVDGTSSEGYYIANSGIDGIIFSLNKAFNCTNNGFQVDSDDGLYTSNLSRNCTSGQAWSGLNHEKDYNKDL